MQKKNTTRDRRVAFERGGGHHHGRHHRGSRLRRTPVCDVAVCEGERSPQSADRSAVESFLGGWTKAPTKVPTRHCWENGTWMKTDRSELDGDNGPNMAKGHGPCLHESPKGIKKVTALGVLGSTD